MFPIDQIFIVFFSQFSCFRIEKATFQRKRHFRWRHDYIGNT